MVVISAECTHLKKIAIYVKSLKGKMLMFVPDMCGGGNMAYQYFNAALAGIAQHFNVTFVVTNIMVGSIVINNCAI